MADAPPELLAAGHLWLQEKIDGAQLRFRIRDSGRIAFGDRSRLYDAGEVPTPYRHAVRHVRQTLDRDAFRTAVEDVEAYVFFGEATHRHTIDYDWRRIPSFLGFDIWAADRRAFLPPDVADRAFSRLGLHPVNTFAKELRAADFDPATYEIPRSAWYDGPAEGVVVRNKNGTRAKLLHPRFEDVDESVSPDVSPSDIARATVTERRIERIVRELQERDRERPVAFEAVYERVLEEVVREEHDRLYRAEAAVDRREFRSEVAARTRRRLAERE